MRKSAALISLIVVVLLATFLLREGDITVVIENVGNEAMHGVVVHVTGASYSVGELAPGAKTVLAVKPKGESHVEIEQSSGPRLIVDCYFESGYSGKVAAKVNPTRVVAVESAIGL
jgi:hypothetical protein